jgi:hypothetical protein
MLHIHVCILSIYLIFWQNSWVFLGIRVHHGGSANDHGGGVEEEEEGDAGRRVAGEGGG